MGFFDRATTLNKEGGGAILYISPVHFFHIRMGCGLSTNTRAGLMVLWVLLYIAQAMGLPNLSIFGDSKFFIDSFSNLARLRVLELDH